MGNITSSLIVSIAAKMARNMQHIFEGCNRGKLIRGLIFFSLFYLVVWLWVDPKLIYYARTQLFSGLSRGFMHTPYHTWTFAGCPFRPGEPIDYLGLCFSQFYRYSWVGALLITATAWLLSFAGNRVITVMGNEKFSILRFIPPVIMGSLFCRYYFYVHYISDSLGLAVALLISYLYMRIPLKNIILRICIFVVLLSGVYVLASLSCMVFIFLCCIFELFIRRNWIGAICIVFLGGLAPYLMSNIYSSLSIKDAYYYTFWFASFFHGYDIVSGYLHFCLFVSIPFAAVVCIAGRIFTIRTKPESASAGKNIVLKALAWNKPNNNCRKTTGNNRAAWGIGTLILLAVFFGSVVLASDTARRERLKVHYFARQQMWGELLRQARKLGNDPKYYYDDFVRLEVNRALYHTGQLADEMFSYPQQPSGLLLFPQPRPRRLVFFPQPPTGWMQLRVTQALSDVLYELGQINYAENSYYEFLTQFRHCPWILKKLTLINIIKQQPDAARVYLRQLLNDPYSDNRTWAHTYLEKLKNDPLLSKDAEIQRLRSFIIPTDTLIDEDYLAKLLEDGIGNRMAFEYFAAQCLLRGELSKFADLIKNLDDFNFTKIPRHYQEAILLHSLLSKDKVDLHGRKLDPQIRQRFQKFMQILRLKNNINNKFAAKSMLQGEYSDTFYFYYNFKLPQMQYVHRSGSTK